MPGEENVVNPPLVLPEKIYLPPLHIRLGLMKNFVKCMDKAGCGFEYMKNKFPKIKKGIFIGPRIKELIQDKQFDEDLNKTDRNTWLSFKRSFNDLLGNHKAGFVDFVQSCGMQYESENPLSGVTLALFSPENLDEVSDGHVESFHQDIMAMEKRYQGKCTSSMLVDYCWTLKMDVPGAKYRRQ
jgi:hypothetical protein